MCLWVLECCNVSLNNASKKYSSGLGFLESCGAWSQKKLFVAHPLLFKTSVCMHKIFVQECMFLSPKKPAMHKNNGVHAHPIVSFGNLSARTENMLRRQCQYRANDEDTK